MNGISALSEKFLKKTRNLSGRH